MASIADLQRAPGAAAPLVPAALPLAVERVRTFDTPEFAGMTFLEVEAKTALNKVRGMPFPWSINAYRGCSHACSYCMSGETPILLADGRTKALAEVRVGDAIYGTEICDGQRRYVITRVLDHWSTTKLAYRVVLADGTELVVSPDHRFLTDRGWRHAARLRDRVLVGTGRFADPPKRTAEYEQGYLAATAGNGDDEPGEQWCRGFLAGAFDARGSWRRGVLQLWSSDAATVNRMMAALQDLGFAFSMQTRADGCGVVRLRGGLREHLRFLHTTDPARPWSVEGRTVGSARRLRVLAVEPLGLELPLYDITTGTGDFVADGVVSHNCFARPSHAYLNLNPLGDFERTIVVKTNVAEVLRRELARPSWRGEHVAMGTNTDPYQRAEGRYQLMPGIIRALGESLTPFSILTKGTLVTRDIPLLAEAAERVRVTAAMTIGMLDETVWRDAEPGTPSPVARLAAVLRLNEAEIPTGIMLAPIMPGLNDDREQLAALVKAAMAAGATSLTPIVLHLRPGVREAFWPWLTERHPELVDRYTALYRGSQAAKAYRDEVTAFVRSRWRRPPRSRCETGHPESAPAPQPQHAPGAQLSLL